MKGLLGLKNRKYNSSFAKGKIIMSKSNSAHLVDAKAGFMMATGKTTADIYWALC